MRDTEQSCNHADETVIDGSCVCTQCAHVIEQHVSATEHDFHKRCMPEKRCYQSRQRLIGVDRHLVSFLKKTNIGEFLSSHFYLHPLQETLHSLKKSCLYNSLNYAIALSCLLFREKSKKSTPLSVDNASILLPVVDAYCWETRPLSDLINNFDSHHEDLQCILHDYVKVVQACDRQSPRQRDVTRRRRRVAARPDESERVSEQYVRGDEV